MGKSDDSITRRKNKSIRKKQNETSKVSTRVAAIIAAKKRRKTGKRSMCQGMCYSLPTPEDPFNDRHGNADLKGYEINKLSPSKTTQRMPTDKNSVAPKKGIPGTNHAVVDHKAQKRARDKNMENEQNTVKPKKAKIFENQDCPSKFLIQCLKSIQSELQHEGVLSSEEDKPLFVDEWGVGFWKCHSIGKDVLQASGACSTVEQVAWIAATAADTIARKEKEGLSLASPFLLFLVPSLEKARTVRSVCKPLKALGIHTISLHPGSSLDHQIQGLRNCEPEFLVSTPERLLELVSLKAVDISMVSLLVVDGVETLYKGGCLDIIKPIRLYITGNPHTVVFNDCSSNESIPDVQNLIPGSFCRLSRNASITSQSVAQ
ncbi:hypothetical protein LguiA_016727 [Lonicera macranthoides]